LTERWPWLIYTVSGAIAAVLGGIIIDLARKVIPLRDVRVSIAINRATQVGELR
jgi:hypothetical protein